MYDTTTRVKLVKKKIKEIQRRRERESLCRLSALCVMLFASLVCTVQSAAGPGQPILIGMYGTILLHEDMGMYILVGVISFTVAVIITLLCIRYREDAKKQKNSLNHSQKQNTEKKL